MAWIELHQSVWTHRKTYLLADALALPPAYAVAHLAALWCWALDNAPDGVLIRDDSQVRVYARVSLYNKGAVRFFDSLVSSGYLDHIGDNQYQLTMDAITSTITCVLHPCAAVDVQTYLTMPGGIIR